MADTAHKRPRWPRVLALVALALALPGFLAVPAMAQEASTTGLKAAHAAAPGGVVATAPSDRPPGFHVTAGQAAKTAARVKQVREQLAKGPLQRQVSVPGYLEDPYRWVVTYSRSGKGVVEVELDGRSGRVAQVWTGPQVDFLLARPWRDNVGRAINAAWIWIPLCVLFLAPFFDPRRPFRLLHLDLLVLLSFGIAQLLFNDGKLYVWVPLIYPALAYLFVRLVLAGFRPRERVEPLVPYARESWLIAGVVLLVIGRIVLNVVDSNVIDVGYTTVVGADELVHGVQVAGYGPLMFLAYVPFEWLFPWHGTWDAVPAAHAAALTFDALTIAGLWLLGRQLRPGREGRLLGIALAYAWVAFPYSTYVLQSNTNDGLVPMLLVYSMLALRSPARSGALLGFATAAKIFPVVLAPLFAMGTGKRSARPVVRFSLAFAGVVAFAIVAFLPPGGIREMWDSTIGYQLSRDSPFSMWGLHPSLEWLQRLIELGVAAFCALLVLFPRERNARQVAALGAAAIVGLQLCTNYWLFFYVAWFAPLALVAMLGAYRSEPEADPREEAPAEPVRRSSHEARRRPGAGGGPAPRRDHDLPEPAEPAEPQPVGVLTVERPAQQSLTVALFSATLLLSAGLVFLVQPMFARFALPLLGGAPAVWTTAMLFFQTVLLLSYLYAHWSIRRFGARRQAALHLALVASALFLLPIGIPDGWTPPAAGSPVPWLLLTMLVTVGLPFFVVSATAPLLQSWLAATDHPDARDPYFLYRASNIGSAVGLLSYPLLVEPRLTLDGQSWLWSAAYGLLMTLLVACAVVLWRSRPARSDAGADAGDDTPEPLGGARRLRWVALAFVPSSLMLAVTAKLTTNLAPIPLLWVLPLALYLASFVMVFSRGEGAGPYHRLALRLVPAALVVAGGLTVLGYTKPLLLIGTLFLAAFFVIAVTCHGELAADRPPARDLTRFYAYVAVGGALGGVFNVVIAPSIFNALTELPIALVLTAFLLPFAVGSWSDQISPVRDLLPPVLVGGATVGLLAAVGDGGALEWVVLGVVGLACLSLTGSPLRFGLAIGLAMVGIWAVNVGDAAVIHQERDFFGVNRVESPKGQFIHVLKNGSIVHGTQLLLDPRRPTAYYDRSGPMGQLLDDLPDRRVANRAAIVGLGAGTMACLSRPGDRWTFFEIDPAVVRLAEDNQLFSYLRDCAGRFDVQVGDGRLSLAKQRDHRYGLIALDAFNSDAVPVHLLTRQALGIYVHKLRPHGVIAFHISNQYLDLAPVLGNVASANGLSCYVQEDTHVTRREIGKFRSRWVAMARTPADLGRVSRDRRWALCPSDPDTRTWTDDYANVTAALRLG
jgi:hypothetical protein